MSTQTPTLAEKRAYAAKAWVRLGASVLLLAGTLWLIDTRELWSRLRAADPKWVIFALVVASVQFALLGARWLFFSRRLGVPLAYGRAVAEYYVSTLFNQVLPFGVLGDALRATRHAARISREGADIPAARVVFALVLDRLSGQLGLLCLVFALAPGWWRKITNAKPSEATFWVLVIATALSLAVAVWWVRSERLGPLRRWISEGLRALLAPQSLCIHLPLSLALVAGHVAVFWGVARSLGMELGPNQAFAIVPPLLLVSTLPAFFAGWGVREAAAAGLYYMTGLSPSDGASVSLLFGAIGLLASTPALFVVYQSRQRR